MIQINIQNKLYIYYNYNLIIYNYINLSMNMYRYFIYIYHSRLSLFSIYICPIADLIKGRCSKMVDF